MVIWKSKPDVVYDPYGLGIDRHRAGQGQLLDLVGKISEENRFSVHTSPGLGVKLDLFVRRFVPDSCTHRALQLTEDVRHQVRLLLQQRLERFGAGYLSKRV